VKLAWRATRVLGTLTYCGHHRFCQISDLQENNFAIAGILALAILGYLMYDKWQAAVSKTLVRVGELEFADMRLGQESFGQSYKLVGRVKNNSRYTVFGIQAKIHVLDCDEKSNCEVVGEEDTDIAPMIPPGQVRDIDDSLYFSNGARVRGHFQWNYTISEIRARR
jgi:hypothetical protein